MVPARGTGRAPRVSQLGAVSCAPRLARHPDAPLPALACSLTAASGLDAAPEASAQQLTGATLAAYVPRRVARSAASACPPQPPCCAPMPAVLLFADVSGYSALCVPAAWMSRPAWCSRALFLLLHRTAWMHTRFEQGAWATCRVLNNRACPTHIAAGQH